MTSRVMTVFLPCPGLQLLARARPELKDRPVAVEGESPRSGRIVECSRLALQAGVAEGMTTARARAACSDLLVLGVSAQDLMALRREVLEALLCVTPVVEWGGGGAFHADASGLSRLFGSERLLLVRACAEIQRVGLMARAACASTRFVASAATRCRQGLSVVRAGEEARFLDPLPLSLLPLTDEAAARLALLGIRTLGQLARLPQDGLADRFGKEAVAWQRLARGEEAEPLVPLPDPRGPGVRRDLDEPVDGIEPVTFLLKSCCEELADALTRRGTAAARVQVAFALDVPQGEERSDVRTLAPSRPLWQARALLDLCRTELQARPLRAPLLGLALSACEEAPQAVAPGELFGQGLDLDGLHGAVDALRLLLGADRVATPAPRPAHRREARRGWQPFRPDLAARDGGALADVPEEAAVEEAERILDPPLPAIVRLPAREAEGSPGSLFLPAAERGAAGARGLPVETEIAEHAGPWRVAGEWWDGGVDVDRDEYVLVGRDGGLYRACRDRRSRAWTLLSFVD
jgi:protein ImuB